MKSTNTLLSLILGLTGATAQATDMEALKVQFSGEIHSFIDLPNARTHYADAGNGPVVVLVHGVSGPMNVWDKTSAELVNAGYRVVRYDLFGRGFSDRISGSSYDLPIYLAQLEDLLTSLKVDSPVTLIGSSFGAVISTEFALHHPEKVSGVIVIGPAGFPIQVSPLAKLGNVPVLGPVVKSLMAETLIKNQNRKYAYDNELFHDFWPYFDAQLKVDGTVEAMLSTMKNAPVSSYLGSYQSFGNTGLPMGIIWGRQDVTFPYENHLKLQEAVPNAQFVTIEHAAHVPQWEQPVETNRTILSMLEAMETSSVNQSTNARASERLSLPAPVSKELDAKLVDNANYFDDSFFKDFSSQSHSLELAPGAIKFYLFPTFYSDVTTSVAVFTVDAKEASQLLPKGLKLKTLIPGKGILAISSYHYGVVRGMVPYNEVAFALMIEGEGDGNHAFVLSMPVTTLENRMRGRLFWGLPKDVMPIDLRQVGEDFVTTIPGVLLRVPMDGKLKSSHQNVNLHSELNGKLVRATSTSLSETHETFNPMALAGLVSSEEGVLTLAQGPQADLLRTLKISRVPFKTSFATNVRSVFKLPK